MLPTGDASGSFRPVPPFAYAASTAPISPRPQSLKGIRKDGGVGAASALKCLVHEGQFVARLTYRAGRYVYVEQGSFQCLTGLVDHEGDARLDVAARATSPRRGKSDSRDCRASFICGSWLGGTFLL